MKSVTLAVVFLLVPTVLLYEFPENFDRCHKSDPDLDNCLKTTIQNALQLIGTTGIPSLNLLPIDPLKVTKLEIGAGTSTVHLVQKYSDLNLLGLSKSIVDNAHLDVGQKVLTFSLRVPVLEQKAKYDLNGKVMVFPIFGNGDSRLTFYDTALNITINFKEETKNNKLHFQVASYKVSIIPNNAHYDFENLFNGDKALGDNILAVLNENWKAVFDDVEEGVAKSYAEIFKIVANGFFNTVPIEEIFLN